MSKIIIYDYTGEPAIEVEDGVATALKDCRVSLSAILHTCDSCKPTVFDLDIVDITPPCF